MEKEDHCIASFSSYSTTGDRIAEIAERVRLEFADESYDEFEFVTLPSSDCDLMYPIFSQNLIAARSSPSIEEDQWNSSSSSSSSDEEELKDISSELYCRWTPEKSLKGRRSKSTGSSSSSWRRWGIKDLLKRSYSEGKQSLKFQNSNSENAIESTNKKKEKEEIVSGHEKYYERKKVMKEGEKRKSYLPYKQHICGFFGKTLLLSS